MIIMVIMYGVIMIMVMMTYTDDVINDDGC